MSFIPWFSPGQFSTSDHAKVTFMSPYHQILLDLLPTTPSLKFRSSSPCLTIASLLMLFSPLDSMSSSKALISSTQITLLSLPLPTLLGGFLFLTLSLFTLQTLPGQFHVDTSQVAQLSMSKTATTTFPQTSLLLPLQQPLFWLTAPLSEQFESCIKVRVSFFLICFCDYKQKETDSRLHNTFFFKHKWVLKGYCNISQTQRKSQHFKWRNQGIQSPGDFRRWSFFPKPSYKHNSRLS